MAGWLVYGSDRGTRWANEVKPSMQVSSMKGFKTFRWSFLYVLRRTVLLRHVQQDGDFFLEATFRPGSFKMSEPLLDVVLKLRLQLQIFRGTCRNYLEGNKNYVSEVAAGEVRPPW